MGMEERQWRKERVMGSFGLVEDFASNVMMFSSIYKNSKACFSSFALASVD